MRTFHVYIMASRSRTLYVGVTNDLIRRVYEHRTGTCSSFTSRYRITRLVHFQQTTNVAAVIAREKEIKGWRRSKKIDLIQSTNPHWRDLASGTKMVRGQSAAIPRCARNDSEIPRYARNDSCALIRMPCEP